jgi:hypothetical protein
MVIGDVTGKGVGATAATSLVRHSACAPSDFDPHPAEIVARNRSRTTEGISAQLLQALGAFQVGAATDDIAVVIMRFTGVPARGGGRSGEEALHAGKGSR